MDSFYSANIQGIPTAFIEGYDGVYDDVIRNPYVRYGRNAANNFQQYLSGLKVRVPEALDEIPNLKELSEDTFQKKMDTILKQSNDALSDIAPFDFSFQYSIPLFGDRKINRMALLGVAFEEMGQKVALSIQNLNQRLQKIFGKNVSAEALDLNNDKKIDIAEYASSILLTDALGSKDDIPAYKNIDGIINKKDMDKSLAYFNKKNLTLTKTVLKHYYDCFELKKCMQYFIDDKNNTIVK